MRHEEWKSAISFWRRDKASSKLFSGFRKISSEKTTLHFRFQANRPKDKTETIESPFSSSLRAIASMYRKSNLSTISFRLSSLPLRRTIITVKLFRWDSNSTMLVLQTLPGKVIEIAAKTFSWWEEEETVHKEHFNGIYACHRKRRHEKDILGWASGDFDSLELPLIRKKKKNSCGLRAEKFFARTKHSSSRLHSIGSEDDVLPDNHANNVGRVQELRKAKIFGTRRNLDLVKDSTSWMTRK